MSEEEFFERAINRIYKDYDYNFANEFKLLFLKKDKEISILKDDKEHLGEFLKESNEEIERLQSIIKEVREKVKGVKKINNEVYKQTDMLERFYSRKWCNDEMDSFLEILDKENKND